MGQNAASLSLIVCQIIVISTLNCHNRIASADGYIILLANFLQATEKKEKTKAKRGEVLLVGVEEARETKDLQPLFI